VTGQAGKAAGGLQYKFGCKKDITTAKTNKIDSKEIRKAFQQEVI
jgi:hypothetical protein